MKLTQIAHATIKAHLEDEEYNVDEETRKRYGRKAASFVTLTKNNDLRGCIGSLEARQELWRDVQENAIRAAFNDFRFSPLTKDELEDVKIEVSVLSEPKKLKDKNAKFMLEQIKKDMGIILKCGKHTATFLPQVWKEIPNKEDFLEHLSLKAGLDKEGWKNAELWAYTVDVEGE